MATALATVTPSLSVELVPPRARPGDAFLVVVRGAGETPLAATVGGRPLRFFPVRGGMAAVGGLPVETPPGPLAVELQGPAEARPRVVARLEVEPARFPRRELAVEKRFVAPPSPELQRRIDEDRAAFARAFTQPPAAPHFSSNFALPREARITANYGEERTLNASKASQHYGMDLAGKVGEPIAAANAGVVVMVRECWAAGRAVVLWHGGDMYTTYFHLSRADVREGDRVRRGQRIGAVGASGRVTGPHLHWGVRVGQLYVDPRTVLALPFDRLLR